MPKQKITKTVKKVTKVSDSLKTDVYNLRGAVVGRTSLPAAIFAAKVSPQLLSQAIRVYQANKRQGTASTKTRSEVAGSTKKIYRQKGTGRARHGAITAPIFIGGGVAHGPKPRDYSLTLPKIMKKQALFGVLTDKLQSGGLKVVRGMEKLETKTKKMDETLTNLKLVERKKKKANILLVTSADFENIKLAGRNIQYLTIENARLLNTYEVISHKNVLFMEDAVPVLASRFFSKDKSHEIPQDVPQKQTKPSPKPASSKITAKKKK